MIVVRLDANTVVAVELHVHAPRLHGRVEPGQQRLRVPVSRIGLQQHGRRAGRASDDTAQELPGRGQRRQRRRHRYVVASQACARSSRSPSSLPAPARSPRGAPRRRRRSATSTSPSPAATPRSATSRAAFWRCTRSGTKRRATSSARRRARSPTSPWATGARRSPTIIRSGEQEDVAAETKALDAAPAHPEVTQRELAFLGAARTLVGDGDFAAHAQRYADAMRAIHERWPDDDEVSTLYAVALLGTVDRKSPAFRRQAEAAALSLDVLRAQPRSSGRGALHHPRLRRSRPRAAGAAGGAALRADRARGVPRAPHAVAHLRAPRHVDRGGGGERVVVGGVADAGSARRSSTRAAATSTACRGCTRSTSSSASAPRRTRCSRARAQTLAEAHERARRGCASIYARWWPRA